MTLTNKLKEMRRREEGFTIVELLIVIIVIAILAALVITAYMGIQQRARDAERQSDIRAIATAVQAQVTIDESDYPDCTNITTANIENLDAEALTPPGETEVTALTDGQAADETRYGCVLGQNATGIEFSYMAESPPEGEDNPITRTIGDYVTPTTP